ncbi:amidohydrolase [Loktanella sp. IMCC34160]|uniref:carbon-nitrogen hydrolase family protein n=1 Tax=Loktanella sp. IMCC34160 TaxID=2510646 RepID=UPI00101E1183|nr:carbon-nitrogen hydrolase family protein [Loktanella sp. IMCC34160]RYG89767.1 amidohydrolase [Loktanella sp. IMCC34160]
MKIAACAYRPEWHPTPAALEAKLAAWVADAAGQGADLLVFPEYAGGEAALIGTPEGEPDPATWADRMADRAEDWAALHQRLARDNGVWILAGSLCAHDAVGRTVNRAYLFGPQGQLDWQDKLILTPYERHEMQISPGHEIRLFNTALGRIGVLICYDSEFPLQARALVEAGADMILVPSATDFPAGQTRVRQSCRARAIEGQCLIVQAPVLGGVAGCDVLDSGTGRVGFFCPPDFGLPSDGIIAQGDTDAPGWVIADVDPAAIAAPRQTGQVGNFAHWTEQDGRVETVTIRSLR